MFKLFGGKKIKKGHLGEESSLYYNEKLKRWVERGKEDEAEKEAELPPPPTTLSNSFSTQSIVSDPGPTSTGSINSTVPDSGPPSVPGVLTAKRSLISQRYVATGFNTSSSKSSAAPFNAFVPAAAAAKPPPTNFFMPKPVSSSDPAGDKETKAAEEAQPPSNPFADYFQSPPQAAGVEPAGEEATEAEKEEEVQATHAAAEFQQQETDKEESAASTEVDRPADEAAESQPLAGVFMAEDAGLDPEESTQHQSGLGHDESAQLMAGVAVAADSTASAYTNMAGVAVAADSTASAYTNMAGYELDTTTATVENAAWGAYSAEQDAEQTAESAYSQPAASGYDAQPSAQDYSGYQFDWSQWGDYSTWTQEQIDYYNSYMTYYAAQGYGGAATGVNAATTHADSGEMVQSAEVDPITSHTETEAMNVGYGSWAADAAADANGVTAEDGTGGWPAVDVVPVADGTTGGWPAVDSVPAADGTAGGWPAVDILPVAGNTTDGWQADNDADGWHVEDVPTGMQTDDVQLLQPAAEEEEAGELGTPMFTDIPLDAHPGGKDKSAHMADDDSASSHDGSAVSEQSSLPESHSKNLFAPLNWIKQKAQGAGGKLVGMPWDNVNPVDYDVYWKETPDDILEQHANGDSALFGSKLHDDIQSPDTTMVNAIQTSPPPKPAGNFGLFSSPLFGSLQPAGNSLPKSVTPTSSVYASSPLLKQPRSTDATTYDSLMATAQQTPTKALMEPAAHRDATHSKDVSSTWGPPPPAPTDQQAPPEPTPASPQPPQPAVDTTGYHSAPAAHPAVNIASVDVTAAPAPDHAAAQDAAAMELLEADPNADGVIMAGSLEGDEPGTVLGLLGEGEGERPVWPGPNGWEYVEGADYSKYSYWPDFTAWGDQSTWDAEKLQTYSEWYYGCQYYQYQQSQSQAASQNGLSAEVSMEQVGHDSSDAAPADVDMTHAGVAATADGSHQGMVTGVAAAGDVAEPAGDLSMEPSSGDQGEEAGEVGLTSALAYDPSYGPHSMGEPSTSRAGPPSHNSHSGDPGRLLSPERHTYDDVQADDIDSSFGLADGTEPGTAGKADGWAGDDDLLDDLDNDPTVEGWHPTLPALAEQVPHVLAEAAAVSMLSPIGRDSSSMQTANTPQPPHTPPRDDHTVSPAYVDEEPARPPHELPSHSAHAYQDAASSQPTTSSTSAHALPADSHHTTHATAAGMPDDDTHDPVSSLPSTSGASHTASLSNASTSAVMAADLSPMPPIHEKHHQHAPNHPSSAAWNSIPADHEGEEDFFAHLGEDIAITDAGVSATVPQQAVHPTDPCTHTSQPSTEAATSSYAAESSNVTTMYTPFPAAGVHDVSAQESEEAEFFAHLGEEEDQQNDVIPASSSDVFQPAATPFTTSHVPAVYDAPEPSKHHAADKVSHTEAINQAFNDPDAFFTGLLGMESERESVGAPTTTPDCPAAFFDQPNTDVQELQQAGTFAGVEAESNAETDAAAGSLHKHGLTPGESLLDGCASPSATTTATVTHLDTEGAAAQQLHSTAQSLTSAPTSPATHATVTTAETTPADTPAGPGSPSHHAAADDVASSSDPAAVAQTYLYDWSQNPRPDWSAWGPKDTWDSNAHAMYADWVRWRKEQQKLRRKTGAKRAPQGTTTPVDSSATTPEHSAAGAETLPVTSVPEEQQLQTLALQDEAQPRVIAEVPVAAVDDSVHDQPGPSASQAAVHHDAPVHEEAPHSTAEHVEPAAVPETRAAVLDPLPQPASDEAVQPLVSEHAAQEAGWAELAQELEEDVWGAGEDVQAEGSVPADGEMCGQQLDAAADVAGAQPTIDESSELAAQVDAYNEKLEKFVREREALVDDYLNLVDQGVEDIEMPDEKDNEGVQELLGNLGKASAQVELLLQFCKDHGLDGEAFLRQNGL